MTMRNFIHRGKAVHLGGPGTLAVTDHGFVSLRNYQGAFLYVCCGTLTGASTLTLKQATNVTSSSFKDLDIDEIDNYYTNLVTSSPSEEQDLWYKKTDNTGAEINLASDTQFIIPINPRNLDVSNRFDCVGFSIGTTAAENTVATLFLHDGPQGIAGSTKVIPGARVNQMPN